MSDTKAPQKTPFPEKELWHETRGRIKEEAVVRANKRWGVSDNEAFVTELLSAQIASLNTENAALRAEIDRLRVRCRQIENEVWHCETQIERLKAAAKDSAHHYADARAEIDRLTRILAALREPSEGMMAAVLNPNATAGRRLAVRFVLDAAVAAAEQEVGRE